MTDKKNHEILLQVDHIKKYFSIKEGFAKTKYVQAVEDAGTSDYQTS